MPPTTSTMNWTEGKSNHRSRGKGRNGESFRQKGFSAKARMRRNQVPDADSPQDVPIQPAEIRFHEMMAPISHGAQEKPCDSSDQTLGEPISTEDGHDSLESKRRRLLAKRDWTGVEIQKPLILGYQRQAKEPVMASMRRDRNDFHGLSRQREKDFLRLQTGSQSLGWSPDRNTIGSPVTERAVSPSEQSVDSRLSKSRYTLPSPHALAEGILPRQLGEQAYVAHSDVRLCHPRPARSTLPPLYCGRSTSPEVEDIILAETDIRASHDSPRKRGLGTSTSGAECSLRDELKVLPTKMTMNDCSVEPCFQSYLGDHVFPKDDETRRDGASRQQPSSPAFVVDRDSLTMTTPGWTPDRRVERVEDLFPDVQGEASLTIPSSMELPEVPNFEGLMELLAEVDEPWIDQRKHGEASVDDGVLVNGIRPRGATRKRVPREGDAAGTAVPGEVSAMAGDVEIGQAGEAGGRRDSECAVGTRVGRGRENRRVSDSTDRVTRAEGEGADQSFVSVQVPLLEGLLEAGEKTPWSDTRPFMVADIRSETGGATVTNDITAHTHERTALMAGPGGGGGGVRGDDDDGGASGAGGVGDAGGAGSAGGQQHGGGTRRIEVKDQGNKERGWGSFKVQQPRVFVEKLASGRDTRAIPTSESGRGSGRGPRWRPAVRLQRQGRRRTSRTKKTKDGGWDMLDRAVAETQTHDYDPISSDDDAG